MAARDSLLTKFIDLPWPVLRNICINLDRYEISQLLNIPQLQSTMVDLLCQDKIIIYPSYNQVKVQWKGEEISMSEHLSENTIARFFQEYPNVNPRVYSVCVQGNFLRVVTTCLHARLSRANAIDIWSSEETTVKTRKRVAKKDLELLLTYPAVRSVDLDHTFMHSQHINLSSIIPQMTNLRSARLQVKKNTKVPILSHLQHLESVEIYLPESDAEINYDADIYTTFEESCKVFPQESFVDGPRPSLKFPPLLKTLQLKRLLLSGIEVSLLPPTLETLDLSFNEIISIYYMDYNPRWPVNLKTLLLQSNDIDDEAMINLPHIAWPPCLQTLDLSGSIFESLETLRNLPDSITDLKLSERLTTLKVSHNIDSYPFFKFPASLKALSLEPCKWLSADMDGAGGPDYTQSRLKFPPNLEHLVLRQGSNPNCLAGMIFPASLKTLVLEDLAIEDLNSYNSAEVSWAQLTNLQELNLNSNAISTLENWYPPKSLRTLRLRDNKITHLQPQLTPLFNELSRDLTRNILFLDLGANKIKWIGNGVYLPENLRTLNLSHNSLREFVFTDPFASHRNLSKLDLRMNEIKNLSVQIPEKKYAPPLRELYLSSTARENVHPGEYRTVFEQLRLSPITTLGENWEDLCQCGVFIFDTRNASFGS